MGETLLQHKIENLQKLADNLLHIGDNNGYIYADDLSALNHQIQKEINTLYSQEGKTTEQEASLCLALLMGYSVSMYANPDDESKKHSILKRSHKVLDILLPSPLKQQLLAVYQENLNF